MRRTLRWLSGGGHNKPAGWGVTLLFDVLGIFFMFPRLLCNNTADKTAADRLRGLGNQCHPCPGASCCAPIGFLIEGQKMRTAVSNPVPFCCRTPFKKWKIEWFSCRST